MNKMNPGSSTTPRRHHVIPKFYLGGFTCSSRSDGALWVLDLETGNGWKATPENSAHRRDFYRIHLADGEDPNEFETQVLAQLEALYAPAVQRIIQSSCIPSDEDLNFLINFISLMAVRVPGARDAINNLGAGCSKALLRSVIRTPEGFHAALIEMRRRGIDVSDVPPFERMREFICSDRYDMIPPHNWFVQHMITCNDIILPQLARRRWSIVSAGDEACDFICSDRPVALNWAIAVPPPLRGTYPGFGTRDSVLTFPLNRRVAVIGTLDGRRPVRELNRHDAAWFNAMTLRYATRYLFSSQEDFLWLRRDGEISGRDELVTRIRRAAADGDT